MKKRIAISFLAAAVLVVGASGAQQQGITTQTLRGYLDKMGFTFTTETGVSYDSFRVAVTELLRIADEYTAILDEYMVKEERKPQSVPDKE